MENQTQFVDKHLRSIQSELGSSDYERARMFHDYMIPKVVETARELGAVNLPNNGEYEQMLAARYNALYTELVSDELSMAEEIRASFNQTREDYYNTHEGHFAYEITRIKQEYEKAKMLFGRPLGQTDASITLLKRTWMVYVILFVIGILEYPLNMSLFRAFGLGKFGTILLAILVVVIIPILSHLTGKFIKQFRERMSNLILGITLGLVLFAFVLFLSVFRYKYFEANNLMLENDIPFSQAFRQVGMKGIFGNTIFWTTFLLNLGLVIIGFALGFLSHDSQDTFEKVFVRFSFHRPKLIEKLSATRKVQHTNFTIQGKQALTREQRLFEKIMEYRRAHEALIRHVENFSEYMDGLCREAVNTFRIHNQAARQDINTIPRIWKEAAVTEKYVLSKRIRPIFVELFEEMEEPLHS